MRKPFVAGNWKMNKTVEQASVLVQELLPGLKDLVEVERVICPPFPALMVLSAQVKGTGIGLGAQNLHWEPSGAFTGEVSAQMVREFCEYVIIGHSERRAYFQESDGLVNQKIKSALSAGLVPIMCVGESLQEYESGETHQVVSRQVLEGLKGVDPSQASMLVIAYEPVWAIGTGKAATGDGANTVVKESIRNPLATLFGSALVQNIRVLYGGSVTSANAEEFFKQPEIDGALVGGASLKPEEFIKIVQAARP